MVIGTELSDSSGSVEVAALTLVDRLTLGTGSAFRPSRLRTASVWRLRTFSELASMRFIARAMMADCMWRVPPGSLALAGTKVVVLLVPAVLLADT